MSPFLPEAPWLLREWGEAGKARSTVASAFQRSCFVFYFIFSKTRLISSESWVEEGVGGRVCMLGWGGQCGWPVITSWTRVGLLG